MDYNKSFVEIMKIFDDCFMIDGFAAADSVDAPRRPSISYAYVFRAVAALLAKKLHGAAA